MLEVRATVNDVQAEVGDTFETEVLLSGHGLVSYQVVLSFDPGYVEPVLSGFQWGNFLSGGIDMQPDVRDDLLMFGRVQFDGIERVPHNSRLATLQWRALREGITGIHVVTEGLRRTKMFADKAPVRVKTLGGKVAIGVPLQPRTALEYFEQYCLDEQLYLQLRGSFVDARQGALQEIVGEMLYLDQGGDSTPVAFRASQIVEFSVGGRGHPPGIPRTVEPPPEFYKLKALHEAGNQATFAWLGEHKTGYIYAANDWAVLLSDGAPNPRISFIVLDNAWTYHGAGPGNEQVWRQAQG